jgi:hypothetical protein
MAGIFKNADEIKAMFSGAMKVGATVGRTAASVADRGAMAASRKAKSVIGVTGAAANRITSIERTPTEAINVVTKSGKQIRTGGIPGAYKTMLGTAGTLGAGAAVLHGVAGTTRDALKSSGVPGAFLATNAIRRSDGAKESTVKNNDPSLGELTLNLTSTSSVNRSIR